MRIKIAILTVIAVSFILLTSCVLTPDIGVYMIMNGITVPYNNVTGYVTVSIDVQNVGSKDLTKRNCQMLWIEKYPYLRKNIMLLLFL